MALQTKVGVFSVYHEDYQQIMRCVYDAMNGMVVGYLDMPDETDEESMREYRDKVEELRKSHEEWAKTAVEADIISVAGAKHLTGSYVHAKGE